MRISNLILNKKGDCMGANTEFTEFFLTDTGWVQGNSKFAGDPICRVELSEEVKLLMEIRDLLKK